MNSLTSLDTSVNYITSTKMNKQKSVKAYLASEMFLSITIEVPRSFTIRSSFGKLKAIV